MANKITVVKGVTEVHFDPQFLINQPACLPKDGVPQLTGYQIGTVISGLAQQMVATKAPEKWCPDCAYDISFQNGEFVVKFLTKEALNGPSQGTVVGPDGKPC
jgi:hypothetical protein